jgi:predicted  nucleic acid-binding Zn-ribbon protein
MNNERKRHLMTPELKALLTLQSMEFSLGNSRQRLVGDKGAKRRRLRKLAGKTLVLAYERRKPNYGGASVVSVRGEFCSGCRIRLSRQVLHRAYHGLTQCDHCARLLYNPTAPQQVRLEVA